MEITWDGDSVFREYILINSVGMRNCRAFTYTTLLNDRFTLSKENIRGSSASSDQTVRKP